VTPRPPAVSERSRAWLEELERAYELGPHERKLAVSAAQALDRAGEAQERLQQDGTYVQDRFGQLRPHPAVAVERDGRAAFTRIVLAMRLPNYTRSGYTPTGGWE